jgi:hypothetical protein
MERWMSGAGVVALWGAFNTVLAGLLAGFTAAGIDGSAGHGGVFAFIVYAAASALIFLIALVVLAGKRPFRGLTEHRRPAAAVFLALGVAFGWLGLAFGVWIALLAAAPLLVALMLEISARR